MQGRGDAGQGVAYGAQDEPSPSRTSQPVASSVSLRRAAASSWGGTCAGASRAFTGPAERPVVPGQVGAVPSPAVPVSPSATWLRQQRLPEPERAPGRGRCRWFDPAVALSPGADRGSRLSCRPCRQGCVTCEDDAPCLIQEDRALRAAVLSCQACCMLAVFLSMLVSYHYRRSKARRPQGVPLRPSPPAPLLSHPQTLRTRGALGAGGSLPWLHPRRAPVEATGCILTPLSLQRIRASGVVLLETILFGSLLLYFPVSIWLCPGLKTSGLGCKGVSSLAGCPTGAGIELAPSRTRARLHLIVNFAGTAPGSCGINLLGKPNPFSAAGCGN